jgi:hypothetical protein
VEPARATIIRNAKTGKIRLLKKKKLFFGFQGFSM